METKIINSLSEDVTPNPEYLIKSISEQGYSFKAAIADLVDNSIAAGAGKIEIFIDSNETPFKLYIVDDGEGMDESTLRKCMRFPSSSPDENRGANDLGRFGLGLKTASFSQTRSFSVITKHKDECVYRARTWDLEFLKTNGWKIQVNSVAEIDMMLRRYEATRNSMLKRFSEFTPKTMVIWKGLYKFEKYLSQKNVETALYEELDSIADHLSLVFHRFLSKPNKSLHIQINNKVIKPFNPFPVMEKDFRSLEFRKKQFGNDVIKIEGFVLPSRSIEETRQGSNIWTTGKKSLMDMEGVYVYRADRLILYGGWNGLIRKAPRLQLARLQVEIGNSADHLLHLNVAKSQVIIPHELKSAFKDYVSNLKAEAEKEFFNRGNERFIGNKDSNQLSVFKKVPSSKGIQLEFNEANLVYQNLVENLSSDQQSSLKILLKMVQTNINKIRQTHEETNISEDKILEDVDLAAKINQMKAAGVSIQMIKSYLLPELGIDLETLPDSVSNELKGK